MDITAKIATLGMSRAEICKKAGISPAYLSLIEKGDRKVGVGKVRDLADALGVTVRDLRPDLADVFTQGEVSPQPSDAA